MRGFTNAYRFMVRFSFLKALLSRCPLTVNQVNTVAIVLLTVILLGQNKTPIPVVFSKGLAITSFATALNDKGVPDSAQRLLIKRFVSALPKALACYAKTHHVVVFAEQDGIVGAPNITSDVLAYIASEMSKPTVGNPRHDT